MWWDELAHPKEGCNSGYGFSASIKLGSLEKTVGAFSIALWCTEVFFCRKNYISFQFATKLQEFGLWGS